MIAAIHNPAVVLVQFVVVFVFLVAGVIRTVQKRRADAARVQDFRRLSRQLSFDSFNPLPGDEFASGWGFLEPLNQGRDRRALNLARGIYHDQTLFVFDYRFTTGSGKSRKIHDTTMLMLVCQKAFPQLTIEPGTLSEKIASAVGMESDIKLESAEFSRKYCVRSPDKKFAYDVCHARMMEFLLANPGMHVEIQGPALMLPFEPLLPVNQIEVKLQRLIAIRELLPEYLFANS